MSSTKNDNWKWREVIAPGELAFRQCQGTNSKRALKHALTFLSVSHMAELDWCEIQSTIGQIRDEPEFSEQARSDDHGNGEQVRERDPRARLLPSNVRPDFRGNRIERGREIEAVYGERYSSLRRHWHFGDVMVIGYPHGLTEAFAYECKSAVVPTSAYTIRKTTAQANLYAALFGKQGYRTHVIGPQGYERFQEGHVRYADAYHLLQRASALRKGRQIFQPPPVGRCQRCRVRHLCSYGVEGKVPTVNELEIAVRHNDKLPSLGRQGSI